MKSKFNSKLSFLDIQYILENKRKIYCGKKRDIEGIDGVKRSFTRLCSLWECPYCGPRKQKLLLEDIKRAWKEKGISRLVTLTLDPKKIPEDTDPLKYIQEVWKKFMAKLKYRINKKISYIKVLEYHESDIPHYHMLVNKYIPRKMLIGLWKKSGGGYNVTINRKNDAQYKQEYLIKCLTEDYFPKGTRRISCSRDIKLTPFNYDTFKE